MLTYADVTEVAPHEFVTEASDLDLPPGRFPDRIETEIGNERPFLLTAFTERGAIYHQDLGCCHLLVFND